jgi:tRNA (guanine37-N1)-methyltransferase
MKFAIISIFPEMFNALTNFGVIGRAVTKNKITLSFINPRDFATDNYRRVDERPFGGGPGMVMLAEPLFEAIKAAKAELGEDTQVIYLSPQGRVFKQQDAPILLNLKKVILLCGRYEGVDQRLLDECVDSEISIGDFVVSGGELPAMLIIDAMTRLIPGVLNDETSSLLETHQGEFVDYPHYTAPRIWHDIPVPEVLLSGDHEKIETWRTEQARNNTLSKQH